MVTVLFLSLKKKIVIKKVTEKYIQGSLLGDVLVEVFFLFFPLDKIFKRINYDRKLVNERIWQRKKNFGVHGKILFMF